MLGWSLGTYKFCLYLPLQLKGCWPYLSIHEFPPWDIRSWPTLTYQVDSLFVEICHDHQGPVDDGGVDGGVVSQEVGNNLDRGHNSVNQVEFGYFYKMGHSRPSCLATTVVHHWGNLNKGCNRNSKMLNLIISKQRIWIIKERGNFFPNFSIVGFKWWKFEITFWIQLCLVMEKKTSQCSQTHLENTLFDLES